MNIPKDWVYETLEKHIFVKHGFAFKSDYFSSEGSYVLLTPGSFNEKGGIRLISEKLKYYTSSIPKDYILSENDLLVVMTEQAPGLLGSAALIPESDKYLHNQRLGLITINHTEIIDKLFLYFIFNSLLVRRPIADTSSGTKVKHTSPSKIYEISIPIPPLREQCRIAEILGVWDESINLLEKLIATKRKLKQGLMQQLLTGKKRFKEFQESEHSIVKISEVAKIRRGASPRPIQDPKWFAEKGRGWVRIRDVTASDTYLMRTSQYLSDLAVEKSVKVDPGDLIMSICATIGVLRIVGIPACIHDGFVVFREFEDQINKFFLYHYINFISSKISDSGQPGTQKNINTTIVGNIEIPKFSIQEQEKIAAILSAADTEISTLEKQLAAYKQQKRGLMQQLLTGRTRILGLEDGQD